MAHDIVFYLFCFSQAYVKVVAEFVNRTNKLRFYECIMVSFLLLKCSFCLGMEVEPVLFVMFLID